MNDEIFKTETNTIRSKTVPGNRNPDCLGTIDQFALLQKLGSGGYGMVYLAEDSFTHVKYALKTILPELKSSVEEMDNLKEKFALVQKLYHPHIAKADFIHRAKDVEFANEEVGRDLRIAPGDPVMVMRYAPGETLSKWRKKFPKGRAPIEKSVEICRQIADALDYAHGQGVVHRDIKPGNISVSEKDGKIDVQVLDFGLAEQIRTSLSRTSRAKIDTSGTRPYMAPEQWSGRDQDGRTDQYALAVVLHELVSGDVPFGYAFSSGDVALMEHKVLHEPVLTVSLLSDDQNRALRKALAKNAADRFGSCREFMEAFAGKIAFEDAPLPKDPPAPPAAPTPVRDGAGGEDLPPDARAVAKAWLALRNGAIAAGRVAGKAARKGGKVLADRFPTLRELLDRGEPPAGMPPDDPGDIPSEADLSDAWVSVASSMPKPRTTSVDLGDGLSFEMVEVPAGSFQMGSRNGRNAEPGRQPGVESRHPVTITVPFQLAAAPVSRGKWRAIMGADPSKGAGTSDDLPVDSVSWEDCQAFLAKLNEEHPVRGYRWKLPTEAQWEFACRAGTPGPFAGTGRIDDMGWYAGNSGGAIHPIRSKKPNAWGFYDMHGNVWEWCADGFIPSLGHDPRTDPCTAPAGMERVVRGGCWNSDAARCRSASRRGMARTARFDSVGFRVALVPES